MMQCCKDANLRFSRAGDEAKGALKTFMALNDVSASSNNLWAKLRQDSKPEKSTEPRPWTQAGGVRASPAVRGGARPGEARSAESSGSAYRGQPSSGAPSRKAFNPRTAGGKKKPFQSSNSNSDGGGSGPGGSAYLGGGGGRKRREEVAEEEDEDYDSEDERAPKYDSDGEEEIPEEILSVLDEDKFIKDVSLFCCLGTFLPIQNE